MEIKRYKVNADDTSRYKNDDRIVYDTGEEIIETADRRKFPRDERDRFYKVESGFEDRLDLISFKFYGSSDYWWVIASASNIEDPFDVKVGTVLRIPELALVLRR